MTAPLAVSVPVKSGSVIGAGVVVVVVVVGVVKVFLLPLPQAAATMATTPSSNPEIKRRMHSP